MQLKNVGDVNVSQKTSLSLRIGKVLQVTENENTRNVVLTLSEDEKEKEEEFEMLIIAQQPLITNQICDLRKKLG